MTVTAHYVDKDWKLNSKLLSFCQLDSGHTRLELSGKVLGALKDWGIMVRYFHSHWIMHLTMIAW